MDIKLLLCVWAFLCLAGFAKSQRPGTDFALVFMQNVHLPGGKNHLELLLTSFFPDTNVNIQLPRQYFSKMVTLTTGIPPRVELPKKLELLGSVRSNMTVRVTSNKPISVVAINKRLHSTGVAVLSPLSDWGAEYYIMTPVSTTEGLGQVAIVNGPKPNSISILLTGLVQFENTTYFPGDQFNLTIGPWESIQLQTIQHLSASRLVSQEDVAVFSGLGCLGGLGLCNHMFIQLPATTAWDKNFVIPPLPFPKPGKVTILSANDTLVSLVNASGTTDVMVAPGMMEEFAIDPTSFLLIESPERIMVLLNFDAASGILYNVPPMVKACIGYAIVSLPEFNNHILLSGHDDDDDQGGVELDCKPLLGLQWGSINMTKLIYANISLSDEKGYRFIYSGGHDFGLATVGIGKSSSYLSPGICLDEEYLPCLFEGANSLCNIAQNTSDYASLTPLTCMAWGQLNLLTFYEYLMLGSGRFPQVLIKFQGDDMSLLPFSVEREPSFGFTVRITVFGQVLEISAEQPGVILIDNEKRYTPISAHDGSLNITRFGFVATMVKTSFGLQVIIGDHGFLHLQIGSHYYESLYGECIARSSKEMVTPTGPTLLPSSEISGPYVLETLKPCENTTATEEELANCQIMAESEIFRSCHLVLKPQPFVEGCEIEVCNGGSSCSAIEAYALICAINGVEMMEWRNISKCGLKCPLHSHYENCYTTCQTSCSETQVSNCDTNLCYEACACDEGYLLSAESCVPKDECGCYWHGSYYPKGEFFGNNCNTRCHCSGFNMECIEIEGCDVGHTCVFMSGLWSCQPVPYTSCSLFGGSHYIALDGQAFHFKGHCDSKMASVCVSSPLLEDFTVSIVQEGELFTSIAAVNILVYGKSITFSQNYKGKVNVDGALVHTPYVVGTNLQIYRSNLGTEILQTDFGLVVSFDQMKNLQIKVPNVYLESICGLCASDVDPVSNFPLCQYCQDGCTHCANENHALVLGCGVIKDPQGAFSGCHDKVAPDPYFEACVSTMCYSLDLCPIAYAYAAACREAGAVVHLQTLYAHCGYSCPPNSTFTSSGACNSGCSPSCDDSLPLTCALECQDGCQCAPGYVLSGDRCVLPEDCGCYVDGQYWNRGDIFYDDECQNRCSCLEAGIVCESHSCTSEEQCTIVMGVRACYPLMTTCSVFGQTYYTFDGYSFLVNKNCPFVMAKVPNSDNEVGFEVLLRRNALADILTSVEEVIVNVYGQVIILNLSIGGLEINDNPTSFPVDLDNRISWYKASSNIELKTEFGLHLTFNSSMVSLTIPLSYVERVFGLCGKANALLGDQTDLPIENYMSFWSTYVEHTTCNDTINEVSDGKQTFNATKNCEVIIEPEGPFQECHGVFDPVIFYDDCLSVMKRTQDYMQEICKIIQYYDNECQWAGATVHPWKNEMLCESERPPVEFPNMPTSMPPAPVNHMECLPNMVPSDCPSLDKINCLFHGPRNSFQQGEDYTECSLSLVEICLDKNSLGVFSVSVHYEFLGNRTIETLHVKVYGLNIILPQNWENIIWVNNMTTTIPVCLIPDQLQIRVEGHDLILDTTVGYTIKYAYNGSIHIQLPFGSKNYLCGQCAKMDPSENGVKFSSEVSKNSENNCLEVVKEPWSSNEDLTNSYYCSMLLGDESPFRDCHKILQTILFYDTCRIQVCGEIHRGGSGEYAACRVLEEFTKLCQLHNVVVKPWRNETVCPYECPPHGSYELCTNTCVQCQEGECSGPCLEGCSCTEGYLWNGVDCVNSSMCPKSIKPVQPTYMNCGATSSQSSCYFCRLNPHQISTFGNILSPLEGNGVYDLIRKCDPFAPQWLRIAISLQPFEPARLYIFYGQNFITINSTLEVWVNGQMEVLPITLAPELYISKATDVVVFGQPGTMEISFSSEGVLGIEVEESLWAELCGACAFSNPFSDDNQEFFLESWRTDDLTW